LSQFDTSPEGRTYTERYQVHDFPHIGIIDPRTGRLLWKKEGWSQQNPMTADSFAEIAMDFCSHNSFDRPPQAPRPPSGGPAASSSSLAPSRPAKRMHEMSEEEQLRAAMQASISEAMTDEDNEEVLYVDDSDSELSGVCLDFTVIEGYGDVRVSHELIDNGANVDVCRDNLTSYIETNIRYRLFDRTLPQVTEILLGFYDVVPEQALTVFDANELEIVLCGLPHIDFDDWKSNTLYHGLFETSGVNAVVITWFWEIVADVYDIEMKARLLQFVKHIKQNIYRRYKPDPTKLHMNYRDLLFRKRHSSTYPSRTDIS
jgi:hypothetical protein